MAFTSVLRWNHREMAVSLYAHAIVCMCGGMSASGADVSWIWEYCISTGFSVDKSCHREAQEQWWSRSPLVAGAHFCACWSFPKRPLCSHREQFGSCGHLVAPFLCVVFSCCAFLTSCIFSYLLCPQSVCASRQPFRVQSTNSVL